MELRTPSAELGDFPLSALRLPTPFSQLSMRNHLKIVPPAVSGNVSLSYQEYAESSDQLKDCLKTISTKDGSEPSSPNTPTFKSRRSYQIRRYVSQRREPDTDQLHNHQERQRRGKSFLTCFAVERGSQKQPFQTVTAKAYVGIILGSRQVVVKHQEHKQLEIASLTKLMTALTLLNCAMRLNIRLKEQIVTVPAVAAEMSGTIAGLQRGDSLSAYELLFGLLLPSGNDAAVALSAHFGHADLRSQDPHGAFSERDSLQHFVRLMNRQAKLIGLQNTHFTNPTGLSDHRNHSTAFQVALLACECMREPIIATVMARKAYNCETRRSRMGTRTFEWRNTNQHLFQSKDCIGGKTGVTPTAGGCLFSAYKVKKTTVIVVVLGSENVQFRFVDASRVLDQCHSALL